MICTYPALCVQTTQSLNMWQLTVSLVPGKLNDLSANLKSSSHHMSKITISDRPVMGGERLIHASLLQISKLVRDALLCHVAQSNSCKYDAACGTAIIHAKAHCN